MSYDLGTAHGKIVLDYNGDKAVGKAEDDIDKLKRKAKDGDKAVAGLGKSLSLLGRGVKLGAIVVALTNAAAQAGAFAIQIAGIVPQLASLLSLSAALPGIYAAIAVSVGVLKASFAGVSDAVTAAFDTESPEKFDAALKKLSPNAQAFAKALKASAPELTKIQQGIQDAFFSNNLEILLPRIVSGLKTLQPTLNGLASDFSRLAKGVVEFVVSGRTINFLSDATQTFRNQLAKLEPNILPVLEGLRAVGNVGLPLMDQLGTAVADVALRFGNWLNAIAADGRLQAWIDTALTTLQQLGTVIGNVFSIFNSLLTAAQATGGGLLGTIAEITGQFADFLKSAEGAEAVQTLFAGVLSVASQLAPVVTTLVRALAGALGPALQDIATEVGPVLLQTVEALAPAFAPLARAIADLLIAVAPLVPPIAKLAALLATVLAGGVSGLSSVLRPLTELLSGPFLDALEELAPVITDALTKALPLAADAGLQLAEALGPLVPAIVAFGIALAQALLPYLPQIMDAVEQLVPPLVELATLFAEQLAGALTDIIPHLPKIIGFLVGMQETILTMVGVGLQLLIFFTNLGKTLMGLPGVIGDAMASFGSAVAGAFTTAWNAVVEFGGQLLGWFQALPGRILDFLKAFPGMLGALFEQTLQTAAFLVGTGLGLIVGLVTKLPTRIGEALASLGVTIWTKVTEAWTGARTRFNEGVSRAVAAARALLPRIAQAIGNLPGQLATLARNAWNRLVDSFADGRNRAERTARDLPPRIVRALGNIGSSLYNSGVNLIQGLINGISSGIGRVLGMVGDLASRVKNAFNDALSIFSPSRVFFESGVNIDEGLIKGIRSRLEKVKKMAIALANSVIKPTVLLPAGAAGALSVGMNTQPTRTPIAEATAPRQFGPYHLEVDGQVLTSIVIDTVTGNPTVVSKAASEGSRRDSWAGSGRRGR